MTEKNNGGPAFPVTVTDKSGQIAPTETGMSLRDYFAAKAMQGLCACPDCVNFKSIASDSYKQADAMLKAREVK